MDKVKKIFKSGSTDEGDKSKTATSSGLANSNPTEPTGTNEQAPTTTTEGNSTPATTGGDTTTTTTGSDPFASQREGSDHPFSANGGTTGAPPQVDGTAGAAPSSPTQGRSSYDDTAEWDASKTPPSRFQQRKGSIYATPSSRDGHVGKNVSRDAAFHELHEKKHGTKRRGSKDGST